MMAAIWSGTQSAHVVEVAVAPSDLLRLARLDATSGLLKANLEGALDECALELASSMESYMHFERGYATGALESSVKIQQDEPLERKIGSAVPYAAFVEFGTGQRGAASGLTPPGGYAYGSRAGMAAQPYATPALEEHITVIGHIMEDAIARTLDGLGY
jgi:HK97 gp10 family phage protein